MTKLICIADTHGMHQQIQKLPEGDVLIHAGDCTSIGSAEDLEFFLDWFCKQPHEDKILIAGNHDWIFERHPDQARRIVEDHNIIYLRDESIIINNNKYWGSPVSPEFCNWAFNVRRGPEIAKYWAKIDKDTDVLITHGPPYKILDKTEMTEGHVGCVDLLQAVKKLKPKVHIFGHIHDCGSQIVEIDGTRFVNCSVLDDYYNMTFEPVVVEI